MRSMQFPSYDTCSATMNKKSLANIGHENMFFKTSIVGHITIERGPFTQLEPLVKSNDIKWSLGLQVKQDFKLSEPEVVEVPYRTFRVE